MARRGVDRLGVTRGRPVAAAVIRRAEMRTVFQHLAWNFYFRLARVVAVPLMPAAGVQRDAAHFRGIGLMPGGPPVGGPLPRIADHVVESITVRRKRPH